ncbi:ABC transporter permease subunit [Shewanella sp. GXUN23E]|uniref:ABC transporter permease subunit n=1 Tax=Shewanella sp. GXUN23E TaxID=3422498 RepID=UPI003D7E5706
MIYRIRLSALRQVAGFELKKTFSGTRGLIGLGAFLLIWLVLLIYPIGSAAHWLSQPGFVDMVRAFSDGQADIILSWQVPELAMFWVFALYLFPLSVLTVSADMFATDRQMGTLRFVLQRASRQEIFWGRLLGHLLLQATLILLAMMATLLMASLRDNSNLLSGLTEALWVFPALVINVLPYLALMAVLSVVCRSARTSIIWAVIILTLGGLLIQLTMHQFGTIPLLADAIPGSQLSAMINTKGIGVMSQALTPVVQSIILLVAGIYIFAGKRL